MLPQCINLTRTNEGSFLIWRRSHYRGFENIFVKRKNCVTGKIKGARNCSYKQKEKLACAVFRVFSRVKECSKARVSQLCELLFLRSLLRFWRFCYPLLLRSESAWTTEASAVLHITRRLARFPRSRGATLFIVKISMGSYERPGWLGNWDLGNRDESVPIWTLQPGDRDETF